MQVEGIVTNEALEKLQTGVTISINNTTYKTLPCKASIMDEPILPERNPPIRFRKNSPTTWLQISITEGKNRQVRKMTAAVGLPTLRLIRYAIGQLNLGNMQPAEIIALSPNTIAKKLFTK